MKNEDKLEKVLKDVKKCTRVIENLISDVDDYDLQRILKKIDAQLIDAQHNLVLAKKMTKEKKKH